MGRMISLSENQLAGLLLNQGRSCTACLNRDCETPDTGCETCRVWAINGRSSAT